MATREWRQANREAVLEYQREYQRDWYVRNASEVRARVSARKKALREWVRAYKSSLAGVRCGETHVACLEFHHRDPSNKDAAVTEMLKRAVSLRRLQDEIAKRDVLCANCHRKLHWKEEADEDPPEVTPP